MADCDGSTEVQSYPAATKAAARAAGLKKYFTGVPWATSRSVGCVTLTAWNAR